MSSFWRIAILGIVSHLQHAESAALPNRQTSQQESHTVDGIRDDTANARAAYTATSLLCMLLMATLFGSRISQVLDPRWRSQISFLRILPLILFFFGIAFNLSGSLAVSGLDLRAKPACKGAIYLCLTFYVCTKASVQLFLIERAHVVRTKFRRRLDDLIWLAGFLVITIGFGTIAAFAFLAPVADIDPTDGQCRIGLPRRSTMVLMTYDIAINLAMTAVFVMLLQPLFRMRQATTSDSTTLVPSSMLHVRPALTNYRSTGVLSGKSGSTSSSTEPLTPKSPRPPASDQAPDHLKVLMCRSIIGALLMLIATVVNLALLFVYIGEEHSWLCFACCLIDVTWSVIVIHFLTDAVRNEDRSPTIVLNDYSPTPIRRPRRAYSS